MPSPSSPLRLLVSAAALAFGLSSLCACGGMFEQRAVPQGSLADGLPGHDPQRCVEQALRGDPHPDDVAAAVPHFQQACVDGDGGACSVLGVMHELGRGVSRDVRRATELYRGACQAKNPRGCLNLGELYAEGIGTERQWPRAAELFSFACREGSPEGCYRLAQLQLERPEARGSALQAAGLYDRACADGHAQSCAELGALYERGQGVAADLTRSAQLYEKACRQGDLAGCFGLDRIGRMKPASPAPSGGPLAAAPRAADRPGGTVRMASAADGLR